MHKQEKHKSHNLGSPCCSIIEISNSPYALDLTHALDLTLPEFLLNKVKHNPKCRIQNVKGVRRIVTTELNDVPLHAFNDGCVQIYEIHKKCVPVNSDYFEGQQELFFFSFHAYLFLQIKT